MDAQNGAAGLNPRVIRVANLDREVPQVVPLDAANALPAQAQQQQQANNQFGAVRDRLFHAMLVRTALSYNRHVPKTARRLVEFSTLLMAVSLLGLMLYVHLMFGRADTTCLSQLAENWPRDGVLRVEVINNLDKFTAYQDWMTEEAERRRVEASNVTYFDLKQILIGGPKALPKELRARHRQPPRRKLDHWSNFLSSEETFFNLFLKPEKSAQRRVAEDENFGAESERGAIDYDDDEDFFDDDDVSEATFEYVVEYSLHYGLLRLPHGYRVDHNIPFLLIRLDPENDSCFGDWLSRAMMKYVIGYEDVLMASVKALAENETDKGYLRDMITGEHYRFVTMGNAKASCCTALFVMLIFTFAISMLLRFSHHQIFLFIVDLLQMFELNQALVFPAAPLLTVILALVGMEAIMSEVFNDTSTAFYVILLVWVADQYDAICCHSPISKRHWLRFFYLYHYAFYAYQYRYNGQYGGLALLTSTFFILHSMIFFFHHYEMPLILYHDRLQRIISDLQHNPPQQATGAAGTGGGGGTAGVPADLTEGGRPVSGERPTAVTHAAIIQRAGDDPVEVASMARRIAAELELNLVSNPGPAPPESSSRSSSSTTNASSSSSSSITAITGNIPPNYLLNESVGGNGGFASGREMREGGMAEGVLVADDPLLAAGERTAREIVDNALSDLF